jgi:hypothetical protein
LITKSHVSRISIPYSTVFFDLMAIRVRQGLWKHVRRSSVKERNYSPQFKAVLVVDFFIKILS